MSAQDFYEYPTIKKLAEFINKKSESLRLKADNYYNYPKKVNYSTKINNDNEKVIKGDILLTGATGFLGIHILKELYDLFPHNIYCLVRGKDFKQKFETMLSFYFPDIDKKEFYKKVILINGDITHQGMGLSEKDYQIIQKKVKSIIHSASLVKHYGNYTEFENVNVQGTKNLITYCLETSSSLSYVSTISVSGNFTYSGEAEKRFSEDDFFIGQDINSNVYLKSKFEAELLIQKAMKEGLKATIYRVGILTGRFLDGKFQYNIKENAFYRTLRSIFALRFLPESVFGDYLEFTPVDLCARALVILFMKNGFSQPVFHLFNHNMIKIEEFLELLKLEGIEVQKISDDAFRDLISSISNTAKGKQILSGIITAWGSQGLSFSPKIEVDSAKTVKLLDDNGFKWPEITGEYIEKIIQYMDSVGFLYENEEKEGFLNYIQNM